MRAWGGGRDGQDERGCRRRGAAALALLICACAPAEPRPAGADGWLSGDTHQKLDTVAAHLRGMDVAMVEIGHRYAELYWAGQDENWAYAAYQVDKIRTAPELAMARRAKRSASAEPFLTGLIPMMEQAVAARGARRFADAFETMTVGCNTCHAAEDLGHIRIGPPKQRTVITFGP